MWYWNVNLWLATLIAIISNQLLLNFLKTGTVRYKHRRRNNFIGNKYLFALHAKYTKAILGKYIDYQISIARIPDITEIWQLHRTVSNKYTDLSPRVLRTVCAIHRLRRTEYTYLIYIAHFVSFHKPIQDIWVE